MLKRLLLGLLKGVVVGGAVGAAFHFGLGWTTAEGLLGYLIAMGTGSTAGVLAGRPPWQQEAWLEAILKALFGVGVGTLVYWLGSSFAAIELPFALAGAPSDRAWTALPLLYAPLIGSLFGAIVELDNTDDDTGGDNDTGSGKAAKNAPKAKGASPSMAELDGLASNDPSGRSKAKKPSG